MVMICFHLILVLSPPPIFLCFHSTLDDPCQSKISLLLFFWRNSPPPRGPGPPRYRSLRITLKRTTFCRTPPIELSALRRYLYLTTHSTYKRQTSMLSAGFEPTIAAIDRPHTHALDRAAAGIGYVLCNALYYPPSSWILDPLQYHSVSHTTFKAYLLRDAPPDWHSITVRSAHTVCMCFVFIWKQTAACATCSINWLVFITEMKSVYSAVRTRY